MDKLPRLLLLEDDPPSQLFLREALAALPAQVDAVATLAQAEIAVRSDDHALWVFDAHLPDGESGDLLRRLRAQQRLTPAIALTADALASRRRELLAIGFAEVGIKPLSVASLHALIRPHLALAPAAPDSAIWDEAHAMAAAGGIDSTRRALRELFLTELPDLRERILDGLQGEAIDTAHASLHRLKGSCAFVGATALLGAVQALAQAPHDPQRRAHFVRECARLLT